MSAKIFKFPIYGGIGGSLWLFWERLMALEWFALLFGWGAWLFRFAGQALLALLALIGAGSHVPDLGGMTVTGEMAVEFVDSLHKMPWREETSSPIIWKIAGKDYWIVLRGVVDEDTLANASGGAVTRKCIELYATPAEKLDDGYRKPKPYLFNNKILKWPHVATECRSGGRSVVEYLINGEWRKTACPTIDATACVQPFKKSDDPRARRPLRENEEPRKEEPERQRRFYNPDKKEGDGKPRYYLKSDEKDETRKPDYTKLNLD